MVRRLYVLSHSMLGISAQAAPVERERYGEERIQLHKHEPRVTCGAHAIIY